MSALGELTDSLGKHDMTPLPRHHWLRGVEIIVIISAINIMLSHLQNTFYVISFLHNNQLEGFKELQEGVVEEVRCDLNLEG